MASARDAESIINCGYARVSIQILSRNTCGKTDEKLSHSKAFQKLFAVVPVYCPDKFYFEQREVSSAALLLEVASAWESL